MLRAERRIGIYDHKAPPKGSATANHMHRYVRVGDTGNSCRDTANGSRVLRGAPHFKPAGLEGSRGSLWFQRVVGKEGIGVGRIQHFGGAFESSLDLAVRADSLAEGLFERIHGMLRERGRVLVCALAETGLAASVKNSGSVVGLAGFTAK